MLMVQAVWIVRLAVSAIFGMAAWAKVADRAATGRALQEFGVPARLTPVLGWALPAVELIVAVAVLPSASALAACWAALALLAVFSMAIGVQLRRGRHPSCLCFGAASTAPIGKRTLARNAGIAVLIGAALWGSWTYVGVPEQLPADQMVILAALVVLGAVQMWQAAALRALRRQLAEIRAAQLSPEGLPVGAVAPEFDLPSIDGRRSTLGSLVAAGRPVALVFMCIWPRDFLDLYDSWVNFFGQDWHGALLYGRDLSGADIHEANLSTANLSTANLSTANISRVNLTEADIHEANLTEANLSKAKLIKADLSKAILSRAILSGADFETANLEGADLSGANLQGAYLGAANLWGANLSKADLSGANLQGTNFVRANLSGANLSKADLSGAKLAEADLRGANLEGAILNRAIMPDGRMY